MKPGTIGWVDLTVDEAGTIRDFYAAVVGWESTEVEMDGYADFAMSPSGEEAPVAGICHARGANAALPPRWLVYITVEDLDRSVAECERLGGHVLVAPRTIGADRFSVIEDPAGAVCALYEPAS